VENADRTQHLSISQFPNDAGTTLKERKNKMAWKKGGIGENLFVIGFGKKEVRKRGLP